MEENILLFVLMILGHLLADYPLQGWLAQAKSKSYWENAEKQNKHDYIPALVCHCVMWGILVFLPITFFCDELGLFWLALPINIVFHCIVDDLKANKKAINLWQDQFAHLTQIFVTWVLYVLLVD
jgi:hypothetical protein